MTCNYIIDRAPKRVVFIVVFHGSSVSMLAERFLYAIQTMSCAGPVQQTGKGRCVMIPDAVADKALPTR